MLLKAVKSKIDWCWCRKKTCFSMDNVESYKDVATKLCHHNMYIKSESKRVRHSDIANTIIHNFWSIHMKLSFHQYLMLLENLLD